MRSPKVDTAETPPSKLPARGNAGGGDYIDVEGKRVYPALH